MSVRIAMFAGRLVDMSDRKGKEGKTVSILGKGWRLAGQRRGVFLCFGNFWAGQFVYFVWPIKLWPSGPGVFLCFRDTASLNFMIF